MSNREHCKNCYFFFDEEQNCKRYPPILLKPQIPPDYYMTFGFPETHKDNWCGEWKADNIMITEEQRRKNSVRIVK